MYNYIMYGGFFVQSWYTIGGNFSNKLFTQKCRDNSLTRLNKSIETRHSVSIITHLYSLMSGEGDRIGTSVDPANFSITIFFKGVCEFIFTAQLVRTASIYLIRIN